MKLIKPSEISEKIMTLIEEAENELIIVSPYNNVSSWIKLQIRIKAAQERGVKITWFVRKNNVKQLNADEVRALHIDPILIDNLHAKVYLNESYAILATMNLSSKSDEKSIDIGYETENEKEYMELRETVEKYIIRIC